MFGSSARLVALTVAIWKIKYKFVMCRNKVTVGLS